MGYCPDPNTENADSPNTFRRGRVGGLLYSDPSLQGFGGDPMSRNDVLIIGAGPSGLFAAAELARHGVNARLIEKEVRPHREARATAL